jgi:hypothetical protein
MKVPPKAAEHLLEMCVWRRFKEKLPMGLPNEGVGFNLFDEDTPEEDQMTVTVTSEGKHLKFEVYTHGCEDYHVFVR